MVVAAVTEVASGSFPHDDDMVTSASVTASAPTCLLVILALISPNHVDRQLSTALVDGQPSRLGDIQWRGRRLGIFGLSDEEAGGLTDRIWLHGWGEDLIVRTITNGWQNSMPAQKTRLGDDQIRVLAAYVWSLSRGGAGGVAAAAPAASAAR